MDEQAFSIIAAAFVTYSVGIGLGRHTAAVLAEKNGAQQLILTAKWQILAYRKHEHNQIEKGSVNIDLAFNIGAFSFPNISIAILVNKLLDPNPTRTRYLYSLVTLQIIFAAISVLIVFLQCRPTEKLWNTSVEGKCLNPNVLNDFSYWLSAYTTMTDIVLAVVPITAFWKLQMKFWTKLGLCIMMGLTLLSAIVTMTKATYLHLFTDHVDPRMSLILSCFRWLLTSLKFSM